jgi:hypothetical protein
MSDDTHRARHAGAQLMTVAGAILVGYAVFSLVRTVNGVRYEVGADRPAPEADPNPAMMDYVDHLHLSLDGFMLATGVAVVCLAWYGVRRGYPWAWATAVATMVTALAVSIPPHFGAAYDYDHLVHLGPIYLAAGAFLAGAAVSWRALHWDARTPADDHVKK